MKGIKDTIRLRGHDIPVKIGFIGLQQLKFYVDNPRIYSIVRADGAKPDQEEIFRKLREMEHVKELVQDIKINGGLIDPVVVRDGTFEVLEGNSRLAAYKLLAAKNPIEWSELKCVLLPKDIDDSSIFALLGQYHIRGKKDWAPFEQAGFLYRRNKQQNIRNSELGKDLGVSATRVAFLISVYEFMVENDDTEPSHWSYYEEYLKSKKIKGLREKYSGFDGFIVSQIKGEAIEKAVHIRDKLPALCSGSKRIVKRFLNKDLSLDDAYELVEASGGTNTTYNKLKRFRSWINDPEAAKLITNIDSSARDKVKYELNKIKSKCITLIRKFPEKDIH